MMEFSLIILLVTGILGLLLICALGVLFFVSRKSQKVMESLLLILTNPDKAKVTDASRVLQTLLSNEISKIENNFKSMQDTLASQINSAEVLKDELSTQNDTLVNTADEAVKKIAVMSQRLDNTVDGLKSVVGSGSWEDVEVASDRFSSRVNELLNNVEITSQVVLDRTLVMQGQIDEWINSGNSLSKTLESNMASNSSNMKVMSSEADVMQLKLVDLGKSVEEGFKAVKETAADYEKSMEINDNLLTEHLSKIDTFTKEAKNLLTTQTNTLNNTANAVGGQIRLAESSIENQVKKLADAVEILMMSAETTEGSVRNVSTELVTLTNRFNSEIKEFTTGVVGELNTVSGVANVTLENTRSAAGAFSESVRAMATGVRETLMEMNTAHTQLSGQSASLIKMSEETTAKLQPLSELIEKYYEALPDLSKGSMEMNDNLEKIVAALGERISEMKSTVFDSMTSINDSSTKLESLSGQSRQQMIDLMSDYAKAVNTMQTLNKQMMVARASAPMEAIKAPVASSYGRISSGDFIKQSEIVISKLHEQSVDLTKSVGAEIPDALWSKYHAGDKTIFSKWFAKMLTAADKKRVRDLLKSDNVFRSQATQFVRGFNKMLSGAEQADNKDMLINTLLKTELGVIYKILKSYV